MGCSACAHTNPVDSEECARCNTVVRPEVEGSLLGGKMPLRISRN